MNIGLLVINLAPFELLFICLGGVQETSVGVSSLEVIQSRDSRELRTQNPEPQGFVEENQDIGPFFEKDNVHSINGSSRHGIAKKNSAANRVKVKQANTKTDMWWMNLRYVLVCARRIFLFTCFSVALP